MEPTPIDPERQARWLAPLGFVLLAAGLLPMNWWMVPLSVVGAACLLISCFSRADGFLLVGPLSFMQTKRASQKPRRWIIRVAVVLVAGVIVLLNLFVGEASKLDNSNAVAEANNSLTTTLGMLLFIYVALLTLNVMCGLVIQLKQMKQWDLLRATDLRRREIIGGLVFGNLPKILEPIFAVTPVLMVLPLFGGVSPWFPMVVLVGCAAFAFGLANMALCFGLRATKATGAGWKCVFVYLGYFILSALFAEASVTKWVTAGVPFRLVNDMAKFDSEEAYWLFVFARFTAFHFLVGVLFFLFGTRRVDEPGVLEPMPSLNPVPLAKGEVREVEVVYIREPQHVERPPLWENHPIAWWTAHGWMNELQATMAKAVDLKLLGILGSMFFLYCLFLRAVTADKPEQVYLVVHVPAGIATGISLCACILPALFRAAGCVVSEKKADTWEPLLLTPYTRREIVMQKFWGVFLSDRPAYYLLVGALVPATVTGFVAFTVSVPLLLGTPLLVASLTAIGLSQSAHAKSKGSAIIYSMAIVFLIGLLVVGFRSFLNCGGGYLVSAFLMMVALPPTISFASDDYFSFWYWLLAMLLTHVFHIFLICIHLRLAISSADEPVELPINSA